MLTESRIALYSQASTLPLALSVRLWVIQAFLHSRLLNPIRRRWRKENEDISRTVKSKTKEVKQLPLTIDWKRLHTLIDHSRYRKGISLKPLQRVRLTRREERREEWVGIWKARQRKWALTRISVLWRCFPLKFLSMIFWNRIRFNLRGRHESLPAVWVGECSGGQNAMDQSLIWEVPPISLLSRKSYSLYHIQLWHLYQLHRTDLKSKQLELEGQVISWVSSTFSLPLSLRSSLSLLLFHSPACALLSLALSIPNLRNHSNLLWNLNSSHLFLELVL